MLMEKKLLLRKRNAMRKMHAETGCGNSALFRQDLSLVKILFVLDEYDFAIQFARQKIEN